MIRYKALISDCDGTLIPNKPDGLPSPKVVEAIHEARTHIHVSIATSRPYDLAKPIIDSLNLRGPNTIHNGGVIFDPISLHIYKEHHLSLETVKNISTQCLQSGYQLCVDEFDRSFIPPDDYPWDKPLYGAFPQHNFTEHEADLFIEKFNHIPDLTIHKIPSWKNEFICVSFGPILSTKQHGVQELSEILSIDPAEMIGIGDGHNDFPLLMACGLKIAMGNAVDDLKAIADYIAPSVEQDGIVNVIHRFILPHS